MIEKSLAQAAPEKRPVKLRPCDGCGERFPCRDLSGSAGTTSLRLRRCGGRAILPGVRPQPRNQVRRSMYAEIDSGIYAELDGGLLIVEAERMYAHPPPRRRAY